LQDLGVAGLFHEPSDSTTGPDGHDPEVASSLGSNRRGCYRHLGAGRHVLVDQRTVVHAIELIAREDQDESMGVVIEVKEILANGVGGALIPVGAVTPLLSGQDLHKARREVVEPVALQNVAVKRAALKLSEHKNSAEVGIDAVAEGDVHQP